ncbi:N-acetyltransferase B complex NatB non catalytic subunit [Nitzschia inconspicua]|uniref:N-acetyltransferase B complex NatB non catalytic subunit n=1 Tax=Nitzschia inconspicua TaxID=303405 RepID=A0A9K3KPD5_9STRA|nr:N-acetyltransferase B complex NatB non catalytic subunit [Nitzschia inconspicua]
MMTSNKLNPIYAALDAHQYNRAIKLASALPESNVLGKALLAHAYVRSGQRHMALITLNKALGEEFYELRHELNFDLESTLERFHAVARATTPAAATPEPAPAASTKKGKKGKKKPPAIVPKQNPSPPTESSTVHDMDLIDQLDTFPSLPEKLDSFPSSENAVTDEITLATFAVSLQSLKLPLTAYQMYSWAALISPSEVTLRKTFCSGLGVLAAPSKWNADSQKRLEAHVLSHLQTIALQYARFLASVGGSPELPTAWAAQVALWQLEWLPDDEKRRQLLPRLAESMVKKLVEGEKSTGVFTAETRLLGLRALEQQSKWDEMLSFLDDALVANETDSGIPQEGSTGLTKTQVFRERANLLKKLNRHEEARILYESLLQEQPDDWSSWKGHLESSIFDGNVEATEELVDRVLKGQEHSPFQLRGPHLMRVELAAEKCRRSTSEDSIRCLADAIRSYSEVFASRAACAFADVESYVNVMLRSDVDTASEAIVSLLDFAETLRCANRSKDSAVENELTTNDKERSSKLRAYIFAIKLTHKLVAARKDVESRYLPDWKEIIGEWESSLSIQACNGGEEKREMKAGDDLVLLAVQQLMYLSKSKNRDFNTELICAALLEKAIMHSTDNPYLKFSAMNIYHQLDAVFRSWELYESIGIKHIQNDSCSFTILTFLLEGGLYNEAIGVCTQLLSFQTGTPRECGDQAGNAVEYGTLSKADEFLAFQREKMNRSLTLYHSKGVILDAAALFATVLPGSGHGDFMMKGGLGIKQGIVGGPDDMERAINLLVHCYSPYAAVSTVSWAQNCGSLDNADMLSDNRDVSILHQNALLVKPKIESKRMMVQDTLMRGHIHGLLLRGALCLDGMKGPKKGKLVKPTESLKKRANSLLEGVLGAAEFIDNQMEFEPKQVGHRSLLHTIIELHRVLALVVAGIPSPADEDTMEHRERHSAEILEKRALLQLKDARQKLSSTTWDVKKVCSILPSYLVPLFSVFRMCVTACTAYGWGKRKQTKIVSVAMGAFAMELNELVEEMMASIKSLPSTESASLTDCDVSEDHLKMLGSDTLESTKAIVIQGRHKTRLRVEPVLQEMDEFLDEFDSAKDT